MTVADLTPAVIAAPQPPLAQPARLRAGRMRKTRLMRWTVITVILVFLLIPILSLFDFSIRLRNGTRNWDSWQPILKLATSDSDETAAIRTGLVASVQLVVATIAIMLLLLIPSMIWVKLKLPRLRRTMEFISLLPLTIPAVALVVGLAPMYRAIAHILSTSSIWLCFAYAILVLPFSYRALDAGLDAIDVKTLAEAARTLGASWPTMVWRIILPNIKSAVVSACFISLALVLGEYTVASLLGRDNLQTSIFLVGQADSRTAAALALVSLLLAFIFLFGLAFFGQGARRTARKGTP